MKAYTLLFVMSVCGMDATQMDFWPNVGTILFTREDLNKRMWTKKDIALLTARRHFQNLIPPPSFIDIEKDFINKMLTYFRDTYTVIKRESPDDDVDRIMTTALSDTVGGYLKLCALPVTKLSFYGGITSYDNAFKVFKFYSEIKKYLCTDGDSWLAPDIKMLNTLLLNIPKILRHKKQMLNTYEYTRNKDPCTCFNYFEKSPEGLVVPMPVVNWDDVTMFLPVYNESTFSLHSPKHCNTLENYYNKARVCMNTKSEASAMDFDTKFQYWLTSDILPHLKDDRLYVALGNVLGLLNQTQETCDTLMHVYNCSGPRSILNPNFSFLCSKTSIIVITIIVFEIIWCVVAIDRLCFKKKTSSDDHDHVGNKFITFFQTCTDRERVQREKDIQEFDVNYTEIAASKPSFMQRLSGCSNYNATDEENYLRHTSYPISDTDSRCQNQSSFKYECPSIGVDPKSRSQTSFLCQVRSSDVLTIVNENIKDFSSHPFPITKPKRTVTKPPCHVCGIITCEDSKTCECDPINFNEIPSSKIAHKNQSAITVYRSRKSAADSTIYQTGQGNALQIGKTVNECKRNESVFGLKPCSTPPMRDDSEDSLEVVKISTINKTPAGSLVYFHDIPTTLSKKANTISEMQTVTMRVDKKTETNVERVMKNKNLINKSTNLVALTLPKDKKGKQSLRKRYLEIKINRPKTEIKLGISDGQHRVKKVQSNIPTRKCIKYTSSSALKRQYELAKISPKRADKSVSSVIQCLEQSTDYTLTQACTVYQLSTEKDNSNVFNQTPQYYSAHESSSLSLQDDSNIWKSSNRDVQSIIAKPENSLENKSDKEDLNSTVKPSDSISSKLSSRSDVTAPCINLKEVALTHNSETIDKERLIHIIYEQSNEGLMTALPTDKEKSENEQIIQQPSERLIELTDECGSQTRGSYILSNFRTKAKVSSKTDVLKLTNTDIKELYTSKMLKHRKAPEPVKKFNKQEQTQETTRTKIEKRCKNAICMTPEPTATSLLNWKNSEGLKNEGKRGQRSFTPTTENVVKMPSIVGKIDKSDNIEDKRQAHDERQRNLSPKRKSKIPQPVRIGDTLTSKNINTDVRLNLSF